jgi:hypothetical protein
MASPVNRSLEGQSEPAASQSSDSNASEHGSVPDGFVYRPDILSDPEEKKLVEILAALDYEEIKMHGVVARRTARRYGFGYDYNRRSAVPGGAEPLPSWLLSLRERCGEALTGTRSALSARRADRVASRLAVVRHDHRCLAACRSPTSLSAWRGQGP